MDDKPQRPKVFTVGGDDIPEEVKRVILEQLGLGDCEIKSATDEEIEEEFGKDVIDGVTATKANVFRVESKGFRKYEDDPLACGCTEHPDDFMDRLRKRMKDDTYAKLIANGYTEEMFCAYITRLALCKNLLLVGYKLNHLMLNHKDRRAAELGLRVLDFLVAETARTNETTELFSNAAHCENGAKMVNELRDLFRVGAVSFGYLDEAD